MILNQLIIVFAFEKSNKKLKYCIDDNKNYTFLHLLKDYEKYCDNQYKIIETDNQEKNLESDIENENNKNSAEKINIGLINGIIILSIVIII